MSTPPRSENPYAGQGSVLLDIGGDVGALVVQMPAGMDGVEVEARAPGSSGHHPHVAVVSRPAGIGPVPSLVFPSLVQGEYALGEKGRTEVRLTAAVRGGRVTQVSWPE